MTHSVTETWIVKERGGKPLSVDVLVAAHLELGGYRFSKDGVGHIGEHHHRDGTVTLIEREAARTAGLLENGLHRRNVVVDADSLQGYVGRTFRIGHTVELRALELCEPCVRLAKLTDRKMPQLRALVHTGLRCEIVRVGAIMPGDKLRLSS